MERKVWDIWQEDGKWHVLFPKRLTMVYKAKWRAEEARNEYKYGLNDGGSHNRSGKIELTELDEYFK